MRDSELNRGSIAEVVIVFAPIEMSTGKMIGQAFQAAVRCLDITDEIVDMWYEEGTRTIVKIAKTPDIFDRVC